MKKTTLIVSALVLSADVSGVQAQLKGSDTLEAVTTAVIAACPGAAGLTYAGGGSGAGGSAMVAGSQEVAPMSRFLNSAECAAGPGTGQGLVIGLDGISIVRSSLGQSASCAGVKTPAIDTLKLLYFGIVGAGAPNCNSPERQALVNNWSSFFTAGCAGESCTQIRHAFRRDDVSGTTDTFKAQLGVSSSAVFCNGTAAANASAQDNDPIRRTCDVNEDVCSGVIIPTAGTGANDASRNGTLGVVLSIAVPTANVPGTSSPFGNTNACAAGRFSYKPWPGADIRCPDGSAKNAGNCRVPLDASGGAGCINRPSNRPSFSNPTNLDGRSYNLVLRDTAGNLVNPGTTSTLQRGAYYKLHASRAIAAGAATCKLLDSTTQIGCLAAASGCSVGFAGREVDQVPSTSILTINGVTPTDANIRSGAYGLSRKLYFNTVKGFGALVNGGRGGPIANAQQSALSQCMANPSTVNPAIVSKGFVTVSANTADPIGVQNCP
jgi:ABC-type phosphate transport system substrate-binding protein